MRIRTVTFKQLTTDEIAAWSHIQRTEPLLASPYFRPEFTESVAAVRNNVEVAVLEENGQRIGFFPYQRSRWNIARPVGTHLSDFHGLIARANVRCDPLDLLQACQLTAWHFDHLPANQACFAPFIWQAADSPYIDLAGGMGAYIAGRQNGHHLMSQFGQKSRKLAREVGPIRFEANISDRTIVYTLVQWKIEQYCRTGAPNIFKCSWVRDLFDKIIEYHGEDFGPFVSVLHAGQTIAAIHFGIRSRGVLHGWFPAYNTQLGRYSPGFLLWIETMKACESLGIHRIDLGKGAESYKQRFMTAASEVAEGAVDVRLGAAFVRGICRQTSDCIRRSPLAVPARAAVRVVRSFVHWLDAQPLTRGRGR
jgi:CelD/BcsL family acetyltransferase involved in cellulose biosynthesis